MGSINFSRFRWTTLGEIATYERALTGKVYPAGTHYLQVSATNGQMGYLKEAGTLESRYVAITRTIDVEPEYLDLIMEEAMPEFLHRHKTGLNLQMDEVGKMALRIHRDKEARDAITMMAKDADRAVEEQEKELAALEKLKNTMLGKLFPQDMPTRHREEPKQEKSGEQMEMDLTSMLLGGKP